MHRRSRSKRRIFCCTKVTWTLSWMLLRVQSYWFEFVCVFMICDIVYSQIRCLYSAPWFPRFHRFEKLRRPVYIEEWYKAVLWRSIFEFRYNWFLVRFLYCRTQSCRQVLISFVISIIEVWFSIFFIVMKSVASSDKRALRSIIKRQVYSGKRMKRSIFVLPS